MSLMTPSCWCAVCRSGSYKLGRLFGVTRIVETGYAWRFNGNGEAIKVRTSEGVIEGGQKRGFELFAVG